MIARPAQSGFSLVELSIVLVILGLLTGGILAGQSLIRAAELRAVSTGIGKYQTALHTFRDKYFALPGDMTNATKFWQSGTSCPSNSSGGTCDGNGDGNIICLPDYTGCEMTFVSQHLALAGLIEGSYNPNWPAADPVPHGAHIFSLKANNLSLMLNYGGPYPVVYYDNYGGKNYLRVGSISTTGYYSGYMDPVIPCGDAWNIDTKMDDGKPGTGKFITPRHWCVTDTTGANYATANYLLDVNSNLVTYLEIDAGL